MRVYIIQVVILILFSVAFANAEVIETAKYKMEHVAGVWQRGYLDGSAKGAMFLGRNIAMDSKGNIFVADITRIRVISREERVWTVAGNGIRGFKDGLADEAMFNMGGRGYNYCSIGVDSKGNIYIPDGYNNRIRRIYKKEDGRWWVETYAGGGNKKLKPVQKGKAREIAIGNPVSLAVDIFDNVWTQGRSCIYKITPSGDMFCYKNIAGNIVNMQADMVGNVYLLVREGWASHYWKLTQEGLIERIAGMTQREVNQLRKQKVRLPVDGPATQVAFWGHGTLGVSHDGKVIYGGNGDEHVLRRIKDGKSMTLFKEGWKIEQRNRRNGWFLGGPILVDNKGRIYLSGNNPPISLRFRRLVLIK